MKKCPFCAEEILETAIKCKHCGEFLNQTSFSTTLKNFSNILLSKVQVYKNKSNDTFQKPTNQLPIKFKNLTFLPESFIYKERSFNYEQIYSISRRHSVTKVNGITTDNTFKCELFIESELFTNDKGLVEIAISNSLLFSNKTKRNEAIEFSSWLLHKTFEHRLQRYLHELELDGYFSYAENIQITNIGDLFVKSEKRGNLCEAYKSGAVDYGMEYYNIWGNKTGANPELLSIQNFGSAGILGSRNLQFETCVDKDVFESLLVLLQENGKII